VFDDAVFDTDLDGGLNAEPPMLETPAHTPPAGMAACNVRVRKPAEKFIPSMQGNKYEIALAQITASLSKSKNALAFAQMSVKLMSKGIEVGKSVIGATLMPDEEPDVAVAVVTVPVVIVIVSLTVTPSVTVGVFIVVLSLSMLLESPVAVVVDVSALRRCRAAVASTILPCPPLPLLVAVACCCRRGR
jgi:hypothetical protein